MNNSDKKLLSALKEYINEEITHTLQELMVVKDAVDTDDEIVVEKPQESVEVIKPKKRGRPSLKRKSGEITS